MQVSNLKYLEDPEVQDLCECLEHEASSTGKLTVDIYERCLSQTCRKNLDSLRRLAYCTCDELLNLVREIQRREICTSLHHYLIFLHAECVKIPVEDVHILWQMLKSVEQGLDPLFRKILSCMRSSSPEDALRVGVYVSLLSIAQLFVKCQASGSDCEHILRGLEWRIRTLIDAHGQDRARQG